MNLIKDKWTKKDKEEFLKFLQSLKNEEKVEWTTNIINTKLPVLAIKSKEINDIAKTIMKGNYESFLDLMIWDYYECTAINGAILSNIKDFNTFKRYLDIYSKKADNWATCDTVKFNIKNSEDNYLSLSKEYINSDLPFVRRIGIDALFSLLKTDKYLDEIFNIINSFEKEEEYYVNMVNAWLVCECFIKHREETIKFFKSNKLNTFTINKAISKCRDSYRITKEDKDMLVRYKR